MARVSAYNLVLYYMAKTFLSLKDPKLGGLDILTFGKLKGCRVCDVIQDHYNYLIWAEKEGYVKFQQIIVETIQEVANFAKWEAPLEGTISDTYTALSGYKDWEQDVPF